MPLDGIGWLKRLLGRPCPRCGRRIRGEERVCASCGLPYVLIRGREGLAHVLNLAERDLLRSLAQAERPFRLVDDDLVLLQHARWILRVAEMALRVREDQGIRVRRDLVHGLARKLGRRLKREIQSNRRGWRRLKGTMLRIEAREKKAILAMDLETVTEYFKLGP
jgi:hypothetical protein